MVKMSNDNSAEKKRIKKVRGRGRENRESVHGHPGSNRDLDESIWGEFQEYTKRRTSTSRPSETTTCQLHHTRLLNQAPENTPYEPQGGVVNHIASSGTQ